MIKALTHPAYPIFSNIEQSIESRIEELGTVNEKSTIKKPLNQARNVLAPIMVHLTPQHLQDTELNMKVSEALHFLDNLQTIDIKRRNGQIPLNITEIHSLVCYISKHYHKIETGRAFKKYRETQTLSLALYYDSWWPFIEHSTANKSAKQVTLDIPKDTEIKLKSGKYINLPDKINVDIDIHTKEQITPQNAQSNVSQMNAQPSVTQSNAQPNVIQPNVTQPNAQPNVIQPNVTQPNAQPNVIQPNVAQPSVTQMNAPKVIDDIFFDIDNPFFLSDDSFEASW